MAKADIQTYYYFRLRNGVEYAIKVTAIKINTAIMHTMYRELTTEQREFFLANHRASVQEVVLCRLNPHYIPPAPDLREHILNKTKELREACYNAVSVTSLEYAMAMDKVNNPTASCYHNITQAKQVLADFRSQSKRAMQVKDTYLPQVEAAQSTEEVDTLFNQAMAAL